jgi:exodeoxyribonuclease VII small subunit
MGVAFFTTTLPYDTIASIAGCVEANRPVGAGAPARSESYAQQAQRLATIAAVMATQLPPDQNDPVRFDDILSRLRGLVERLESGNLALEDGLRYFEEGMELCRQGASVLDKAEKRVEILLSAAGGEACTEPLDGEEDEGEAK